MKQEREFPDWEELYSNGEVEKMPWYHEGLDPDLDAALSRLGLKEGTFLDLGTGPGTQAIALAGRGFIVTATDLSGAAVERAGRLAAEKGVRVNFLKDDITDTRLTEKFDCVFDRGCFHVQPPARRPAYVRTLDGLLKPGGYLFIKCFSHEETGMEGGPYRFTPGDIQGLFSSRFTILSIEDTVYHGTLDPLPKALFSVLRKK